MGNVSARGPFPGSADPAGVLSPSARGVHSGKVQDRAAVGVGDVGRDLAAQDRVRQEPMVQERLTQSARTPHYSVPANRNQGSSSGSSSSRSQDHRAQQGPHHSVATVHNSNSSDQQQQQQQSPHQSLKREPPPYHKVANISHHDRHFPTQEKRDFRPGPLQTQDVKFSPDLTTPGLTSPKPQQDPRRRPLNGMILSNGPLSLQDKRIINNVPPLDIPSEDLSTASDSAVSDDVFVQSCTDPIPAGSSVQSSDFRRFSTGMLSKERTDTDGEEKPEVVTVNMRQEPSSGHVTVEKYPDDIYIDVVKELEPSVSARQLKVLPLEDGAGSPLTNGECRNPGCLLGCVALWWCGFNYTFYCFFYSDILRCFRL